MAKGDPWKVLQAEADVCEYANRKGKEKKLICKKGDHPTICLITQQQRCKIFVTEVLPSLGKEAKDAFKSLGGKKTAALQKLPVKDPELSLTLPQIAEAIEEKRQEALVHGRAMMRAAADIGGLLTMAKAYFRADNDFGEWAQATVGFSRQHRTRLMRLNKLAQEKPKEFESVESWRAAITLWQEPKEPTPRADPKATAAAEKIDYTNSLSICQNQLLLAIDFLQQTVNDEIDKPRAMAFQTLKQMKAIGPLPETKMPDLEKG
jgi:hypothetical protein